MPKSYVLIEKNAPRLYLGISVEIVILENLPVGRQEREYKIQNFGF